MYTSDSTKNLHATQKEISIYSTPTQIIKSYNRLHPENPLTTKQVLTAICGDDLKCIADKFGVSVDAVLLVIEKHSINFNDLVSVRFGKTDAHDTNDNTHILIAHKGAMVEMQPKTEWARNGKKRVIGYENIYYNIYLGYNMFSQLALHKLVKAMFQTYFPMAYAHFSMVEKRFSKEVREFDYKPNTLLQDLPLETRNLTLKDIADIINSNNECLETTALKSKLVFYYTRTAIPTISIYLNFLNQKENNYHSSVSLSIEAFKTNDFSLIESEIVHDYDYKTQVFADIQQCQSSAWSDKETIDLIKGYFDKVKNS